MITREVAPSEEPGDISTFTTISPMRPAVVVHSSQYASRPFTLSLPTTAYSNVVLLPSAEVTSYGAPEPTVGVNTPAGIEGRVPIPIWALAEAARIVKQNAHATANLKFFMMSSFV